MAWSEWLVLLLSYLTVTLVIIEVTGFDLSCLNNSPLLISNGNDDAFIGGYKGGSDFTQMGVAFNRPVDMGTGLELPTGHTEGDFNGGRSRRLLMPAVGGIERIGVFNCEGEQNGEFNNITAIIVDSNGDPRSEQVTIAANLGDRVVIDVARDDTSKAISWSKDGKYVSDFDDLTTVVIEYVTNEDGGIYDCYYQNERSSAKQAIVRLIVRECPVRMWGPPVCSNDCPFCYNGGVCDDKTGDCICAPGFGGTYCDQIYGRNTFGQSGDHRCEGRSPNSSPGCIGKQLCALDPYGCSCAAGYMGRDCLIECNPGTFGADCKQTCHCAYGPSACENATGICQTGVCLPGWLGDNCQVCETGVRELSVSSFNSTSVSVSWTSPVNDATFIVVYTLLNTDQCQPETTNPITLPAQRDTSVLISNLSPYSTYEITVTSNAWPPCLQNEATQTHITSETAPSQEPQNVHVAIQQINSLTFQWDPIECGYRGGNAIMYEYSINSTPPRSGTVSSTIRSFSDLEACTEYTFSIKAINEVGAGPETSIIAATTDTVPDDVEGLVASNVIYQPDKLHVQWNPALCAETYTVNYQTTKIDQCLDTTEPLQRFWDGDATSVTITGLDAYSTYQVFVQSNNSVGYGESSGYGITDLATPSGIPEGLKLASKTNTSLTFEWSRVPCGQRGGPNDFVYTLFDHNGILFDTGTVSSLSVTVYGLDSCANYSMVVKAANERGSGNPSDYVFGETSEGVPAPVQNLKTEQITSNSWSLTWSPQNDDTCKTSEYVIEYTLTNKDQCENIIDPKRIVHGNVIDPMVEISGLNPNSDFTVYVVPLNGYGRGDETFETGTTLETEPSGPPVNLQVIDLGKSYIAYSWEEPPCGQRNGVIQRYVYSTSSGQEGVTSDISLIINDLLPCTEYSFSVSAVTNIGTGPASVTTETTETDVPHSPTDLTQQCRFLDEMCVSWKRPSPQYCEILKYMVTIRTVFKPYDEHFVPDPDPDDAIEVLSTQHTFVYLQPSTEYEIRVWGFTEEGPGDITIGEFYTKAADNTTYLGEPLPKPKIQSSTETTLTVRIPQVLYPEQYVTDYQIRVNTDVGHGTYIAGMIDVKEVENAPVDFTVGDGSEDSSNPPLDKKNQKYIIYIGTCSVISKTDTGCVWSEGRNYGVQQSSLSTGAIVGIVIGVFIVIG